MKLFEKQSKTYCERIQLTHGYIYSYETYAPVTRLEDIRMILAFSCITYFKLFQMYVNNTFLNGYIHETLFVNQPPSFINLTFLDHVFKLKKA